MANSSKLPAWLTLKGKPFDREQALADGYAAVTYFIIAPDERYYIGKKTLRYLKKNDFKNYGGSASDLTYQKMVKDNPSGFERYVVGVFRTQKEALDREEQITRMHDENGNELWTTEENVNMVPGGGGIPGNNSNPMKQMKNRKRASEATTENWKDPKVRAKRIAGIVRSLAARGGMVFSEEICCLISEKVAASWQDPIKRQNRLNGMAAFYADPVKSKNHADKIGKNARKYWDDEEWRENMVEIIRKTQGKAVVFGFKGRQFVLETTSDWKAYLKKSSLGGSFHDWLTDKVKSYEKYGLEFVRRFAETDDIADFENPWNDEDVRRELRENFRTL